MPTPQGAPPEDLAIRGVIGRLADVAFLEREAGYDGHGRGGAVLLLLNKGAPGARDLSCPICLHHRHPRSVCPSLRSVSPNVKGKKKGHSFW